jgi:hypothetical protein
VSVEPPTFVRWVEADAAIEVLVNEATYRAWSFGAEHAVLTQETGERPMVMGVRDGIRFDVEGEGTDRVILVDIEGCRIRVERIEWHTHPRVTGPSDGDREAIQILKQQASRIYEMGGESDGTIFGQHKGKPLA